MLKVTDYLLVALTVFKSRGGSILTNNVCFSQIKLNCDCYNLKNIATESCQSFSLIVAQIQGCTFWFSYKNFRSQNEIILNQYMEKKIINSKLCFQCFENMPFFFCYIAICIGTHLFPCLPFMALFFNLRGNEWQKFKNHSYSKAWLLMALCREAR